MTVRHSGMQRRSHEESREMAHPSSPPPVTPGYTEPVTGYGDADAEIGGVDGGVIYPGTVASTKFASTIRAPEVVDVLPTLPDDAYPSGSLAFYTVDEKLYRNTDGSTWSVATDAVDIVASWITAGAIAAGAIGANEIAAGAVTASKIAVGGTSGTAFLTNPGFETGDLTGWSEYDPNSAGNLYIEAVATSGVKLGTGLYQAVLAKTSALDGPMAESEPLATRSGDYIVASCLMSGSGSIGVHFKNAAGSYLTGSWPSFAGAAGRVSTGAIVAPADAAYVYFVIRADAAPNSWLVFDDLRVSIGDATIGSGSGNVVIDSTGIAITNGKLSVTDASGNTTVSGGLIKVSGITSSADRVNLLRNGSFEEFTGTAAVYANPCPLTGWNASYSGVVATAIASANAKSGSYIGAYKGVSAAAYSHVWQTVQVRPGRKYRLSGWLWKAAAGGTTLSLVGHSYDKTGTVVSWNVFSMGATTSGTPTHYSGVWTCPTGTSQLQVRLAMGAVAPADTEIFAFEDIFLEEVPTDVENSDGNVVIDSTGITVTNGKISVYPGDGTTPVIIDGSSNMFKILASATMSISATANTASSTSSVLSGLGTFAYVPATLNFITSSGTTSGLRQPGTALWTDGAARYVAASSGGSPTTREVGIPIIARHWAELSGTSVKMYLDYENRSAIGATIYGRYYVLKEAAI